jgi:hypothetical protein
VVFAIQLIKGKNKKEAYSHMQNVALEYAEKQGFNLKGLSFFIGF